MKAPSSPKKIALFGGTFDPVHLGHLWVAEAAQQMAALDQVIFLPSFHPPHKRDVFAPAKDRLAMVRLAIRGNAALTASDWELRQKRVVYTFEALDYFSQKWPRAVLHFILGSDSLRDLPGWRGGTALLKRATFLVVEREEALWHSIPLALRRLSRRIPVSAVPFASHVLRASISAGRSVRYELPPGVGEYIARHHLYTTKVHEK